MLTNKVFLRKTKRGNILKVRKLYKIYKIKIVTLFLFTTLDHKRTLFTHRFVVWQLALYHLSAREARFSVVRGAGVKKFPPQRGTLLVAGYERNS